MREGVGVVLDQHRQRQRQTPGGPDRRHVDVAASAAAAPRRTKPRRVHLRRDRDAEALAAVEPARVDRAERQRDRLLDRGLGATAGPVERLGTRFDTIAPRDRSAAVLMCSTPISTPRKKTASGTSSNRMPGRPTRPGSGRHGHARRLAHQPGAEQARDDMPRGRAVQPQLARQLGPALPAEAVQRAEHGDLVALPDAARGNCGEHGVDQDWSPAPSGRARSAPAPARSGSRVGGAPACRLVPLQVDERLGVRGERLVVGPGVAPDRAGERSAHRRRRRRRTTRR